jgi:hypothetical protein
MKLLTNTAAVMDALGGNAAVQRLTGDRATTVSNWRHSKTFPADLYDLMREALGELGYRAPAALWRQRKRRKKKKPARSATGKRETIKARRADGRKRKRARAQKLAGLAHRKALRPVAAKLGNGNRPASGDDAQCDNRQGEPIASAPQAAESASKETTA